MFDRPTSQISGSPVPGILANPLPQGRFPLDLELQFAEMRAAAPSRPVWRTLLVSGALFQVALIVEFHLRLVTRFDFGVRGVCGTLVLLAAAISLAGGRAKSRQAAWQILCCVLLSAALVGGIAFPSLNQMFLAQIAVAALMVVGGWAVSESRRWAALGVAAILVADAACLLLGPSPAWLGAPVRVSALWGPGFAAAVVLLASLVRNHEARREFLLLRHAALGSTTAAGNGGETRHLDPQTGVAARAAFDIAFRSAWDGAAAQRKPVALLFFTIDDLAERKRELGFQCVELLQRRIAGLLQEGLRESGDMVARFDHHHFVVMLPGVGRDGTTQIAERLRGNIEAMVVYQGQARHSATVTVGAASMRAKRGIPRENLIEAAVLSLEQARAFGPNNVCVEGVGCVPRMN